MYIEFLPQEDLLHIRYKVQSIESWLGKDSLLIVTAVWYTENTGCFLYKDELVNAV